MKNSKVEFYNCSCYGEGIIMEYQFDDNQVDLSFWQRGFNDKKMSWNNRFRLIWKTLTTGFPYNDMVILTKEEAGRLGNDLLLFSITPVKELT